MWEEVDHLRPWPEVVEGILGKPGVEGTGVGVLTLVVKRAYAVAADAPPLPIGVITATFSRKKGRLTGLQPTCTLAQLNVICRGKPFSWGLEAQDGGAGSNPAMQLVLWVH